jgi:hypothetical protein
MLDAVQLIVPPVAVALGGTISFVTVAVVELVQPLIAEVVVNTYVPTAVAIGFCCDEVKLPGPVQA